MSSKSSLSTNERDRFVVGHRTKIENGSFDVTDEEAFISLSPFRSQRESILIQGRSKSGKSTLGYLLALEEYNKGKTVVFFDPMQNYLKYIDQLPQDAVIMSPHYQCLHNIGDVKINSEYYIPPYQLDMEILFELAGLNSKAGYAKSLDYILKKRILSEGEDLTIADILDSIQNIANDPRMSRMRWVYEMLYKKIEDMDDLFFKQGESELIQSIKNTDPKFIVITFPFDDFNSSFFSVMIKELFQYLLQMRLKNSEKEVSIFVDDFHFLTEKKENSSWEYLRALLLGLGLNIGSRRVFIGDQSQLPRIFRGDIDSGYGLYTIVMKTKSIPSFGMVDWINNSCPSDDLKGKRQISNVKFFSL